MRPNLCVAIVAVSTAVLVACSSTPETVTPPAFTPTVHPEPSGPTTVLIWSFERYDASTVARLRAAGGPGTTAVRTGSVPVASGDPAYPEIPVDAIAVQPRGYALAMGAPSLAPLLQRGAVLSLTEARLRRVAPGDTIRVLGGTDVHVSGVVPDTDIGGYGIAMSVRRAARFGSWSVGFVLAPHVRNPRALHARVTRILGTNAVRVRRAGVRPFLRRGDDVLPQTLVQAKFGEFAVRRTGSDAIDIDPAWRIRHIATADVPILGRVTCNHGVLADLRAVMRQLVRRHLTRLVDPAQYGGCWAPRNIRGAAEVSRHAWGIAIDINVASNPLGSPGDQDPRLVRIFEEHHFTWGGGWVTRPDPQHFEWVGNATAYAEPLP